MSDIVERLRQMVWDRLEGFHDPGICAELNGAADEIERLRAELDTMNNNHRSMAQLLADTGRERDDLRALVEVQSPGEMEVVDREYYQGVIKELRASVERLRAALTEIASLPDEESDLFAVSPQDRT